MFAGRMAGVFGRKTPPVVLVSPLVPLPLSLGLRSPVIVLPEDMLRGTDDGQLQAVLLHEWAHIVRHDQWIGLGERIVGILFWWNPLVGGVCERISELREAICDTYVVQIQGDGATLARVLLDLAAEVSAVGPLAVAVGVLEPRRTGFAARVTRLLNKEQDMSIRMTFLSRLFVLVGGSALALLVMFARISVADAEEPNAAPPQGAVASDSLTRADARQDAGQPATGRDTNTLVARVKAAWLQREKEIRSCRFEWIETRTTMKESLTNLGRGKGPSQENNQGGKWPSQDVVHKVVHKLSLDGEKMRYSREGTAESATAGTFYESRLYVSTFDGRESRSFYNPAGDGPSQYPLGFRGPARQHSEVETNADVRAILLAFRAANPTMGIGGEHYPWDRASADAQKADLNGHRCVVFRQVSRNGSQKTTYWLDEARGFLVLRSITAFEGHPYFQLDIDYKHDAARGWIPDRWEYLSRTLEGKAERHSKSQVTRHEINPVIPADEFRFTFHPGTQVRGPGDDDYFVRADGTWRTIGSAERLTNATYADYFSAEFGKGVPPGFAELMVQTRALPGSNPAERKRILNDLDKYLAGQKPDVRMFLLVSSAARQLDSGGETGIAAALCRKHAPRFGTLGAKLSYLADTLEGGARFKRLPGNRIEITGTTVEGNAFDWNTYRGKAILVVFWDTASPFLQELPSIKRNYERYHGQGFEVVGISTWADREDLTRLLHERAVPWTDLYEANGQTQPTIKYYGITLFPTQILVGRDGKVISLDAKGEELDRLLKGVLRPAKK
jgi:hypothetical protein